MVNLLFGFSGRIGRGQWWLAQLAILVVIAAGVALICAIVLADDPNREVGIGGGLDPNVTQILLLIGATSIPAIWINFAATVKRFHDRDKSGFWSLLLFVPYIGAIWVTIECGFLSGSLDTNGYGPPGGYGYADHDDFSESAAYQYSTPESRMYSAPEPSTRYSTPAAAIADAVRPVSQTRRPAPVFGRRGAA